MNTMNLRNQSKKGSKVSTTPTHPARKHNTFSAVMWIIIGYVASLFIPGINAYTAYPLAVTKCGGKPVIASKFMGGRTYMTSENKYYSISFTNDPLLYYCSAQDAEQAGFRPAALGE
jgi:hypothetical protein